MALKEFRKGYSIMGFDFGNVSNGETSPEMDSFLDGIDYGDGNGIALLEKNDSGEPREYLVAMKQDGILALMVGEVLLYINQDVQGFASAGFNNLTNGKFVDSPVEIANISTETGWNGTLIGAVLTETPLTQFGVGQTITGIDFGNVQNGEPSDAMDAFLASLTYDGGDCNILESISGGDDYYPLLANDLGDGKYMLWGVADNVVYSTFEDTAHGVSIGFQNLTNGKDVGSTTYTLTAVSSAQGWNGILVGAVVEGGDEPVDTVTAGTYSAATGIWTDNADYEIADNGDGTYDVTGLIPYGRADSLFAYPGYRFAVKISRDSITSRDDLPDGNICTVTVGSETTTYTKSAFETDGSLIYIAAPVSETLATPRVVKIAWSIAGSTVEESDFTSYTFDLSDAELAPIPEETEDESRVAYCITPKITSDKFVKVVAPSGGLRAGQVVNCVSLASSVAGVPLNLEVYSPSLPTTATLDSRFYCLIVNGGFEKLEDGRRPSGNPDYTTYVYNEGDVCQGILLDKNLVFEISGSCISGDTSLDPSADIGRYIVPVNGTYVLSIANAPTAGGCLKIIGTAQFRKGGILNDAFVSTYIALAIH